MKPTKHVAVLIETSREFGRGLLRGVSRFYNENGRWSIYFEQHDLRDPVPAWLRSWKGDGILARIINRPMAKRLLETKLPLIDLRGGSRPLGLPPFGPRSDSICRMAFQHLHELGLHHFAFCGEQRGRFYYDDERRDWFQRIAADHGYDCHVFAPGGRQAARTWEEEQRQLGAWLKSLPKPIGIMACHDDQGQKILDACRRRGLLVPDEVAVIGVDNDPFLCNLSIPSLSSIDVNTERIGYEAAALLDKLMRNHTQLTQPVFFDPAEVVARQSTDVRACPDPEIAAVIRFISQHACDGITVTEIERRAALSRSLLNRRFKSIVGRSPKAEILRVQLATAQRLLLDTDFPISDVCQKTGFSTPRYFIEVFRKRFGATPRVFRVRHGRHDGLAG